VILIRKKESVILRYTVSDISLPSKLQKLSRVDLSVKYDYTDLKQQFV